MNLEKTRDPMVMMSKSGGGCLMLFGSPFFLVGVFLMSTAVGLVKMEGDDPGLALLPFGFIFAAVGAGLMFGRGGTILDQRNKTAEKWWGLLVPFSRKSFPLDSYNLVSIRKEIRRSKNSTTTYYPVRIESNTAPVESLQVATNTSYAVSRKAAEDTAKFLNVSLHDFTSGQEVVREAGKLDESLRERARRGVVSEPMPPRPAPMAARLHESSGAVRIVFPPPGNSIFSYIGIIPASIFAGIASIFFLAIAGTKDMPLGLRVMFMGFLGIFFIAFPLLASIIPLLRNRVSTQTVTADPGSLKVETKGLLRTTFIEIPANEIEEIIILGPPDAQGPFFGQDAIPKEQLEYGVSTGQPGVPNLPGGQATVNFLSSLARHGKLSGMEVRSDKVTASFGRGISHSELAYLRAVIEKALAG